MAVRRAPANGKPKLSAATEARVIIAAELANVSPSALLERFTLAGLEAERQEIKVRKFNTAKRDYEAGRGPSPMAQDFGLPPDFGIPPAFR